MMNSKLDRPTVSVIIPVYNVEPYLKECIDSILNQSFTDFELLLVDDGSKDGSGQVCENYILIDNRVKVIHQANSGASSARNKGIDVAVGKWIVFVDSDDFVLPTYLEHLLLPISENNVDFVVGGLQYWNPVTNVKELCSFRPGIYENKDIAKIFNEYQIFKYGGPIAKMYNADIVRRYSISFNKDLHFAEDCDFMLRYINHIHSVSFVEHVDYVYRLSVSSLSHKKLPVNTELLCLNEMLARYSEIATLFDKKDLRVFKVSIMQYFLRTVNAVLCHGYSLRRSVQISNTLYVKMVNFYSKEEIGMYEPYCKNEAILYKCFLHKRTCFLFFYVRFLFPVIYKLKQHI